MLPRATRRLTERTATKPAKSLVRSSVSRTVSLATTLPHGAHFRRDQGGRKGDAVARFRGYFAAAPFRGPTCSGRQRRRGRRRGIAWSMPCHVQCLVSRKFATANPRGNGAAITIFAQAAPRGES